MCASSSNIVLSSISSPWGDGSERSSEETAFLDACTSIYYKALSFAPVSSNKLSSCPVKRNIQLYAFRASSNPDLSPELQEIVSHVYQWSLNLDRESPLFPHRYVTIEPGKERKMSEITSLLRKASCHDPIYSPESLERAAVEIIKWGIGNCWEYACLIYVLLMELKQIDAEFPMSMEFVHIESTYDVVTNEDVDHVFILVARDPVSDLMVPSSWGAKALVIDPWWEKLGFATRYRDVFERHADHMRLIFSGIVGQGHSPSWTEIFPGGELMQFSPPKKQTEQIPWAMEKKQEIVNFAHRTIKTLEVLGKSSYLVPCDAFYDLTVLKPWLLDRKKIHLPSEVKIGCLCALIPLYKCLPEGVWGAASFNAQDFWTLWNDPDIQRWVNVEESAPNPDQISLTTAFELFQTAFNHKIERLCVELLNVNKPLRAFLESKGFILSREMFSVYEHEHYRKQLQVI